jgi:thiosulfate dehydrogenase [quinone] large subunit
METRPTITLRREPGPLVRSLVALNLRLALGLIFLMLGVSKFQAMRSGQYPASMISQFAGSPLAPAQVKVFATVLPFAEVGLGIALICGLLTILAASLSGALLIALLFGKLVLGDIAALPQMLTYVLANAGILWLSPVTSNYFSLDGLIFGWFWSSADEGQFARAEPAPPREAVRAAPPRVPVPVRPQKPPPPAAPQRRRVTRSDDAPGMFIS